MPYGLPKNIDTPSNNAKIEKCVVSIMKTGKRKDQAIAICKAQIEKNVKNETKEKASDKFIGQVPFAFGDAELQSMADGVPTWIHVLPVGFWEHDGYGDVEITASDVQEFAMNFQANLRKGVYITAGHEGDIELPAVGWFTEVEVRSDGLWGKVQWNELGRETLQDKRFKFFSPEFYKKFEDPETHQVFDNVLTGGALTKSPYFKELEAVVFSEKFINKEGAMNIKKILKKKAAERTEEEVEFLKKHREEMSEEEGEKYDEEEAESEKQKKAEAKKKKEDEGDEDEGEGEPDGDETEDAKKEASKKAKKEASEKGFVRLSATEYSMLTEKADKGMHAFAELEAKKLSESVSKLIFAEGNKEGKFLPKSEKDLKKFMETLNAKQHLAFSELLKQLPETSVKQMFSEEGEGGGEAKEESAEGELVKKTDEAFKASEGKVSYTETMKKVYSENPKLVAKAEEERAKKIAKK